MPSRRRAPLERVNWTENQIWVRDAAAEICCSHLTGGRRRVAAPPYPMRTAYCRTRLRRRAGTGGRRRVAAPPYPMRTAYCETRLRRREAPSSSTSTVAVAEPRRAQIPLRLDHPRLPADIEYSILLRLPVKTLTRFKCASKSWSSLISSPQFHQDHCRHSESHPKLLLLRRANSKTLEFNTFYVDGPPISKFYKTVPNLYLTDTVLPIQSCLGLVCIANKYEDRPILICNPSTEELIVLPHVRLHLFLCTGFGYTAVTNEFKVVRFSTDRPSLPKYCTVFTLGTSEWREARNPAPYKVRPGTAPYLNGSLHLLPHTFGEENWYISAFDVECEEEYKRIPFPEYSHTVTETSNYFHKMCLHVLGGSLCFSILYWESGEKMELWFLKDYINVEWVKGYHIDFSKLHLNFPGWAHPVGFMVDGTILLNICKERRIEYLPYYPNDEKFADESIKDCLGAFYVESFIPQRNRCSIA